MQIASYGNIAITDRFDQMALRDRASNIFDQTYPFEESPNGPISDPC